jgi:molybdopterin-guanine dinucleotide biosynthesis protein A
MNGGSSILAGIFIGGRSTRMGGVPKGTLREPHGTRNLVERLLHVVQAADGASTSVLVGECAGYESLPIERLADEPAGIGPLGGLVALLNAAENRGFSRVLALACDLPFVNEALVARLIAHAPEAAAVAPHLDGRWQPLCARYATAPGLHAASAALAAGEHSLQRVLERLGGGAERLPLPEHEHALLDDWDSPTDASPQR